MPSIAVIGTQWGDEGKAKIVDFLAENAEAVVRTSGGNNAGHSVEMNGTRYRFSSVPCGLLYPHVLGILGNGTAINPPELIAELAMLRSQGLSVENIRISSRAHVVMPYHLILDSLMDESRGENGDGTPSGSKRGIRPCYMDKIERIGIRMCDLLNPDEFAHKVRNIVKVKNRIISRVYGGVEQVDADDIIEEYLRCGRELAPYITDTGYLLATMLDEGKRVIFEGAQAVMLDPDYGTYPYVTSSHPSVGGVATGSGVGLNRINHVIGVTKAYTTRAGKGPFLTEIFNKAGDDLRDRGNEYEVTGQARRVGWLDAFALRYAVRVNGMEGLALTKLYVLQNLSEVKICTGYKLNGAALNAFPSSTDVMAGCEPIYETLPGWGRIDGFNTYEELPQTAKDFVCRIEELTGTPIMMVELGRGRNKLIKRDSLPEWLMGKEA